MGYVGATQETGLALLYWEAGAWRDAGSATATADEYQLAITTPAAIRRALSGDVDELVLAITPRGDNGKSAAMARLDVDAAEVRVTYTFE